MNRYSISYQRSRVLRSSPRFENVNKLALPNPKAAIDLISRAPVNNVPNDFVYCDGGGDLGHPKIYIKLAM